MNEDNNYTESILNNSYEPQPGLFDYDEENGDTFLEY